MKRYKLFLLNLINLVKLRLVNKEIIKIII